MALAYLCSRSQRVVAHPRVADNPTGTFRCLIVDHKLRPGSSQEALAVQENIKALGLRAQILSARWTATLAATGYAHQSDLPNIETLARRARYRQLAAACTRGSMASLLLAHHQDDQYETVLMRLLSGHTRAGLLGMRTATDIPECHDMHGAYQSGFVDDQRSIRPMINFRPSRYQLKHIRQLMVAEMNPDYIAGELREGTGPGTLGEEDFNAYVPKTKWLLPTAPPQVEDGGIMIYRPLLEFSKDRLVATCEAARVPWFEDATNSDPKLTMRNAVRHLYKYHALPVALQKPAILDLSKRLKRQAALDEAEAARLLARTVVCDFEPTAGTVVVQLPSFRVPRLRNRRDDKAGRVKRLEHNRRIAAILVKRLIAIVTPEVQGGFASNLQNTVLRLFPSLHDRPFAAPVDPKPFNVSSVHFVPLRAIKNPKEPIRWYLTREPYVTGRSQPQCDFRRLPLRYRWHRHPDQWRWPTYTAWKLWDGRFWVHLRNRAPVHAAVAAFDIKHAKAFRDSLPDGQARDELMSLLKLYAPGKVRYTLPAIYTAGDHAAAIADHVRVAEREMAELLEDAEAEAKWQDLSETEHKEAYRTAVLWETGCGANCGKDWAKRGVIHGKKEDNRVLVALPTLGIAKPGLSDWIQYEMRFKRVDRRTLEGSMGDEKEMARLQKAKRRVRMVGATRWRDRFSLKRRRLAWQPKTRPRRSSRRLG